MELILWPKGPTRETPGKYYANGLSLAVALPANGLPFAAALPTNGLLLAAALPANGLLFAAALPALFVNGLLLSVAAKPALGACGTSSANFKASTLVKPEIAELMPADTP